MIPMQSQDEDASRAITDALERINRSGALGDKSRLIALLTYVVEQELAGEGDKIKAYSIGVDVLARPEDFDPNTDSIVRVEFNRLRRALEHYYLTSGAEDPVRITIPSGTYRPGFASVPAELPPPPTAQQHMRPTFSRRVMWAGGLVLAVVLVAVGAFLQYWQQRSAPIPTFARADVIEVVINPFVSPTAMPHGLTLANGISEELITSLSSNSNFRVRLGGESYEKFLELARTRMPGTNLSYALDGTVQQIGEEIRVFINLVEPFSNTLIWGKTYRSTTVDLARTQDDTIKNVVTDLHPQLFGAAKRQLERRQVANLTARELYLQATWVPGQATSTLAREQERVALAERAILLDPELGEAHAVLADKYAYLANVDPQSDTPEFRQLAEYHAQLAQQLAPGKADVMFNLHVHYWHAGDLQTAQQFVERTVELDTHHPLAAMLKLASPYTCLPPPPEVISRVAAFDASLSKDNPVRWVTLYWGAILNSNAGNFKRALQLQHQANLIFVTPDTIYRHAALLNILGQPDKAYEHIERYRASWPTLDINHYASATIARRCGNSDQTFAARQIFADLASAMSKIQKR